MFRNRRLSQLLVAVALFTSTLSAAALAVAPARQAELDRLRAELKIQFRSIEDHFAKLREAQPRAVGSQRRGVIMAPSPAGATLPPDEHPDYDPPHAPGNDAPHDPASLRRWQNELSRRFALAADTVEQMLKLDPPDAPALAETLETLRLYARPVSSPDTRAVFGAGEVQARARLKETPEAAYPEEARAAGARGEVRLRVVLAADGTVKHVFPIQSAAHGLTESAVDAARRITFEPAVRDNEPASQFLTLVYDFKKRRAVAPYVPKTVF
jgi:TonB family protein